MKQSSSAKLTVAPFSLLMVFLALEPVTAQTPDEIIRGYVQAYYYAGDDGRADVTMKLVNREGKERLRQMTMLRKNMGDKGDQRYYVYFHRPADVRGTVFMVWKNAAREDDRWLYVPAIDLVKRIAANDKRSSFVGSDFTYEDVSGRRPDEDKHELTGEDTIGGRKAFVIKNTPLDPADMEYSYRTIWIDQETFLPLKEEYYNQRGELYKVFKGERIEEVEGIPTLTHRVMENLESGHKTEVLMGGIDYNLGLDERVFTEISLRRPPREWIK